MQQDWWGPLEYFHSRATKQTPDASGAEQMAEFVSMPILCQRSEGLVHPVTRQHSST